MKMQVYNLSEREIFKKFKTSKKGLSEKEFLKRVKKYGTNSLPQKGLKTPFGIFLEQFQSPLVIIILVAMFFSFLIGHWLDALFIVFVVLVNATVGTCFGCW